MNKSERIMAERMTFRTTRGRTIESERAKWLRSLRDSRGHQDEPFVVHVYGCFFCTARTMRQAKIKGLAERCKLMNEHGLNPWVAIFDKVTGIRLWNN